MSAPIVAASGLNTYYGNSHILRGVDFRIAAGETVALMGRNGMGKTTLLRSLVGLVRPRSGTLSVAGLDGTSAPPDAIARAGIALVPEGRGIFTSLTVRENLTMAARPGPDGRQDWTLDRVLQLFPRLAERSRQWGGQLSGGEQQMLTIGRALLTNPRVLLLDEATEGLAPLIAREVWEIVRTIAATDMAVVIVDKNVAALSALADRVVILAKGVVVFQDTPAGLAAAPEVLHRHLGV